MKPHLDNLSVTGNLPGEQRDFQIDPRAIAHILKLLTNLYSNVPLAVIRELSTNAIDSHIQAGVTDPIEVTTPSPLSNFLVIRDHGVGMSVEELFGLFSMYGASTKRESDEVTGMLGIGSKSPLAYTDSFTLISRKDGVEATVAITKGEDGVGRLNVVDTRSTTVRNGVEIRVPVKNGDPDSFSDAAAKLFRYWEPGTVLLNGKPPLTFEGLDLGDEMFLVKNTNRYSGEQSVVIQGRVPYPSGDALATSTLGLPYGYAAVCRLPIGTVDPAPSRELLEFTPRTRAALEQVKVKFVARLHAAVQAKLDNAATKFEALQVWHEWYAVVNARQRGGMTPQWRGLALPTSMAVPTKQGKNQYGPDTTVQDGHMTLVSRDRGGRASSQKVSSTDVTHVLRSVFVTNYDVSSFTARHKARLMQWLDSQPDTVKGQDGDGRHHINHFVLLDFKADLSWIPSERVVDWSIIKAIKLPSSAPGAPGSSGRIMGSFDLYVGKSQGVPGQRDQIGIPGDKIDTSAPVYWIHGNADDARRVAITLDAISDKWTIVCLPLNRVEKFKRENPLIENVNDALAAMAVKELATLIDDERMALAIEVAGDRSDFQPFYAFEASIDDPDVLEAIRLSKIDIERASKLRSKYARTSDVVLPEWENPLIKYVLMDSYALRSDPQHVIRYMNMEHAHATANAS